MKGITGFETAIVMHLFLTGWLLFDANTDRGCLNFTHFFLPTILLHSNSTLVTVVLKDSPKHLSDVGKPSFTIEPDWHKRWERGK